MRIVSGIHKSLQLGFECVLITVVARVDLILNAPKTAQHINRRLLIARWWILEIGQSALKL